MLRAKRTRTDRTQVQGVIIPKKGLEVSENAYIGGSDAHDGRPARATPEVERRARRSRTNEGAPPAIANQHDHFSLELLRRNQVRPRARPFNAFKAVESSFERGKTREKRRQRARASRRTRRQRRGRLRRFRRRRRCRRRLRQRRRRSLCPAPLCDFKHILQVSYQHISCN